ncbi:CoA transferase [uncultured Nocardioides sp.]|uniref:CoA transferase n=1 Tax=uncultured Nocardioides sp. TaxID=198441 RepID=UPI002629C19E|nr:CoA transferase [uncultured Nocardioides sp.]
MADWAASGAMALTGRSDGPPLVSPGDPAGAVRRALAPFAELDGAPDIAVLGERAALSGLGRRAPWSCGGAFRLWPTRDGWWGASLARPEDRDLVPALVEAALADGDDALAAWAATVTSAEAEERGRLLGLPCARTGAADRTRPGVLSTPGGRRAAIGDRPLVVDFTSLWAGPLCAHLLALAGARVVKVESRTRPDGARRGPRAFYDLLHSGSAAVSVDFGAAADREALRELVAGADLVLESSRPRALARLGLDAAALVASGVSWLSITARGRDEDAIGFGDDVAAGGGLVREVDGVPVSCGDALADPLSGTAAAAHALAALRAERAQLIDVSMHHVCVEAGGELAPHEVVRRGDAWWVEWDGGAAPVAQPRARTAVGRARDLGADDDAILGSRR